MATLRYQYHPNHYQNNNINNSNNNYCCASSHSSRIRSRSLLSISSSSSSSAARNSNNNNSNNNNKKTPSLHIVRAALDQHTEKKLSTTMDDPSSSSSSSSPASYSFSTRALHPALIDEKNGAAKGGGGDPYRAMSAPLYQTATFAQPSAVEMGEYDYTRSGNPTRSELERLMSELEGGCEAGSFAFTSGMAAIAAAARLVKSGESVLAGEDVYGGTSRLLDQVLPTYGVNVKNVDMRRLDLVEEALNASDGNKIAMVMVESPTNPRMNIIDIEAIAEMAHKVGALVLMDNSILAPVFQQPLALGADICMTSTTKFIGGHSDTTGGTLTVRDPELAKRIYFIQNAEGSGLSPFDCWLCLRGIKTMALRMERQAENCLAMAKFLESHPIVKHVNYAGLESDAGYHLNKKQAKSAGSLLSFTTGDAEVSQAIVAASKLFKVTVSFGSVSSLMSMPCYMSHASIPKEVREARGLPDDLIRISAGIEDIDDLIADLKVALDAGARVRAE